MACQKKKKKKITQLSKQYNYHVAIIKEVQLSSCINYYVAVTDRQLSPLVMSLIKSTSTVFNKRYIQSVLFRLVKFKLTFCSSTGIVSRLAYKICIPASHKNSNNKQTNYFEGL